MGLQEGTGCVLKRDDEVLWSLIAHTTPSIENEKWQWVFWNNFNNGAMVCIESCSRVLISVGRFPHFCENRIVPIFT
jgi:hypothetical protein